MAVTLAQAFVARGLRVEFVLMRASGPLLADVSSEVDIFDLGVDRVRDVVGPLVRYIRSRRPRALLASMWPLTSASVIAHRLARTRGRLVLSEHTDWSAKAVAPTAFERVLLSATMRMTFPCASGVVVVSQGAAEGLSRRSGISLERISVIYNPLTPLPPPTTMAPDVETAWLADGSPALIAIGRLQAAKDYPTLLRAMQIVRRSLPARLLLLGEGPLRSEIEQLRSTLGLDKAVLMPGFVRDPQPYLRKADIFVMSSAWEGFGNVIVEALACGTPVVSTDCRSGPREILSDGEFGDLVPVGDAEALAAAILAALARRHDKQRLIDRSNAFSIAGAASRYLDLLLSNNGQQAP